MELLLNLAWLLLALPAYWLWRDSNSDRRRRFTSIQCLMALACMLVVLFPIVSATDDLHAMRAEMEESSTGKRSFCQKSGDRASHWRGESQPSLVSNSISLSSAHEIWREAPTSWFHVYAVAPDQAAVRGPPITCIG